MIARSIVLHLAMLASAAMIGAIPASAQVASEAAPAAQGDADAGLSVDDDGGLTGSVSDDSQLPYLGIAITNFATDEDVPTRTNAGSTAALGRNISQIIADNLRNNGLFKPSGPLGLPQPSFDEVRAPAYPVWSLRSTEMLVQGYVHANPDGQLTVGCYLYDVALKHLLAKAGWVVAPGEWRRAAHKCSDMVYSRLSGESPFFDSRIAYIAETGPKDHRMKRLAIMDSDGANHRYITSGQATALTPRYSPDYKSIVYLPYLDGKPSIYIYVHLCNRQRLVTKSSNPTFAPRWSPDGKWILY